MSNKEKVIKILKENNLTLGVVESFTGGLFSSSIVDVAGASSFFKGSVVSYSNEIKTNIVNVSAELIQEVGVVSGKVALEMAKGGKALLNVDLCLAFTGNAGPTVLDGKEKGDVYIAVIYKNLEIVEYYQLDFDRNSVRKEGVKKGWDVLYRVLNQK
ncbi:MAG TPA: CinA family protein [Bacilli bacterium]|nr:CinA family protein [Bacilli bacterium]